MPLSLRAKPLTIVHAAAAAGGSLEPAPSNAPAGSIEAYLSAFWRFLRPHTIRGTILGTSMVVSRALLENPTLINWALLPTALLGLVALLCGNGYIVGINQIYDVDIDQVNKPFLPIASGELSAKAAWVLCFLLAGTGIGITSYLFGPLISGLYAFGLFLGTIYSVPPLRLKRFAVPAFMIIATVRGFLLNFGVYYATRAALGLTEFVWSPAIAFITVFVTLFATVIAITKDLPDVEGDKKYNIQTFATKLGVRNISLLAVGILALDYSIAIYLAATQPAVFRPVAMGMGHTLLLSLLMYQTWRLDLQQYKTKSLQEFYRFLWNLFYSTYLLLPFI